MYAGFHNVCIHYVKVDFTNVSGFQFIPSRCAEWGFFVCYHCYHNNIVLMIILTRVIIAVINNRIPPLFYNAVQEEVQPVHRYSKSFCTLLYRNTG